MNRPEEKSQDTISALGLPRKFSLGHYKASRTEWLRAYRCARLRCRRGTHAVPQSQGVWWKAQLIVSFERHAYCDRLMWPVMARLAERQLIRELTDGTHTAGDRAKSTGRSSLVISK